MKLPSYSRKDLKSLALKLCFGAAIHIGASQYIKRHPELFEKENIKLVNKNTNRKLRKLLVRGGAVLTIATVMGVIQFLAKTGLLKSVVSDALTKILNIIPTYAISKYIREASVQNLSHLEKKWFKTDIEKLQEPSVKDFCDNSFRYLFQILNEPTVPVEEKERISLYVLTRYCNLKTHTGRVSLTLCITLILFLLSTQTPSGYVIFLKNLIQAIKEGKISRKLARIIIRRLQRKGIRIDPKLVEMASD